MPWLSNVIFTKLADRSISYVLVSEDDPCTLSPSSHVIHKVHIYNTGDLKLMAMLLGMDDMSGEWCIYCMLRQKQWLNNEVGPPRKIKKLVELANQNLSGPNL